MQTPVAAFVGASARLLCRGHSINLCAARNLAAHSSRHRTMSSSGSEVVADVRNSVACITLNRPKALNSLNINMVERLLAVCMEYGQASCPVSCLLVKGAGGKAFCAGGDVKWAVLAARSGDTASPMHFFRLEYTNNLALAQLAKPYVALIDGIVMGGGVGISLHGHFRVATPRTVFAMPEVGIGLFPDVGASFFLHRLPGHLGRYLALTGARLTGPELKEAGIATHVVPEARIAEVEERVVQLGSRACDLSQVDKVLRECEDDQAAGSSGASPSAPAGPAASTSAPPVSPQLPGLLDWKLPIINAHFGLGSVAEVLASLEAAAATRGGGDRTAAFLQETLAAMRKASPLSQAVSWELLQRGRHLTLQQCLEMEFNLVSKFVGGQADFYEGVRAVLVDKGDKPAWRYGSVREVPDAGVQELFAPTPGLRLFDGSLVSVGTASRM